MNKHFRVNLKRYLKFHQPTFLIQKDFGVQLEAILKLHNKQTFSMRPGFELQVEVKCNKWTKVIRDASILLSNLLLFQNSISQLIIQSILQNI